MEGWDKGTKSVVGEIPLLSTRAGPRDGEAWRQRLKEEYRALIAYTSVNKSKDNDWFRISAANPEGTRWEGTCWYVHNLRRYEFPLQFDIPVAYPQVAPEIELPTLDGKTHKVWFLVYSPHAFLQFCPFMRILFDWIVIDVAVDGYADVPWREDLPHRALQAAVGEELPKVRDRARAVPRPGAVAGSGGADSSRFGHG